MTRRLAVIALALVACVAATPSRSDDYPSRPVRIVFGFGPGSSGDVMTRVLAQRMSQDLGQPFIVEGKPGANGQLGAAQVASAPNDGYTLFLASVSNATNVAMTPASATDLAKELVPIALVATVPSILVVHPSLGVANVQELIALAKAKPDQLLFRVAVVRRTRDLERAELAVGARLALDDERLAEVLAHALRQHTSHDVTGTARSESKQDTDRTRGIILGMSRRRNESGEQDECDVYDAI